MKKVLMMIVVALSVFATARAEKGDMGFGVNLLYGSEYESIGVGVKFQYSILDQVRIEPSFNYFFGNDDKQYDHAWELNVTGHYLFPMSDRFNLYPLAGVAISSANFNLGDSKTKFGINLGGGLEYELTYNWKLNFEARYSIVSDIDQAVLGIGAVYKF